MQPFSPKRSRYTTILLAIAVLIAASIIFYYQTASPNSKIKVTLLSKGYEHVHSPIKIEWLNDNSEVIKTTILNDKNPNVWALSIVSIENTNTGLNINLSGTHSYSLEDKDFTLQISNNEISGDFVPQL